MLKAAVETHGSKDWAAIALLVPGRASALNDRVRPWIQASTSRMDGSVDG
jgi:hypothetical protein